VKKGDVLVTDMTDPNWEPVMKLAAAIVTNRGGRTCHAAIIARELGIPAVVGCGDATHKLKDGQSVTGFLRRRAIPATCSKACCRSRCRAASAARCRASR
jgi:phosphoenolpyruvate synthase/pyruvate phosphate dikinase